MTAAGDALMEFFGDLNEFFCAVFHRDGDISELWCKTTLERVLAVNLSCLPERI